MNFKFIPIKSFPGKLIIGMLMNATEINIIIKINLSLRNVELM